MRISDWSSDVCSSDLRSKCFEPQPIGRFGKPNAGIVRDACGIGGEVDEIDRSPHRPAPPVERARDAPAVGMEGDVDPGAQRAEQQPVERAQRSEEHTSELQSLMRISYAVFCLK